MLTKKTMKIKIDGSKFKFEDLKNVKQFTVKTLTTRGVDITYEIQINYDVDKRKSFIYNKKKLMILDYQKIVLKILL